MDGSDTSSRSSSPLLPLSRSPSPPEEYGRYSYLPSPSTSKHSSASGSPCPESMDSSDGPPAKRRRLTEPKPRTTQYLDLRSEDLLIGQKSQVDKLLKVLHKKRKIVVVAGAGISVSAGIPDFRSSTGLFSSLKSQHNLKSSGKDLFDASVYKDDASTSTFHDMVRSLSESTKSAKPTAFHHVLATLAQEGRLLRLYSQNVDGIDTSLPPLATEVPLGRKAPWPKTIQLHGGLDKMVCSKCHSLSDFQPELFRGPVPPSCTECEVLDNLRTTVAGKRSHGVGRLRPRMVLYNEHNPDDEAIGSVAQADLKTRPDAVIVAGTTLKVPGVRRIVREMCAVVRDRRDGVTVWINNDPEPIGKDLENCWDLVVRGPCDDVARLACMRKWDEEDCSQVVSDEDFRKAKEESAKVEVQIISPRKIKVLESIHGLPTPVASPRLQPQSSQSADPTDYPQSQPTPTKSRKTLPASKGPSIREVLSSRKTSAKPETKSKTISKKNAVAKSNAKITFKVSKPTSQATRYTRKPQLETQESATVAAKSQSKPQASPKKSGGAKVAIPMEPLSPQAARNNGSPPTKRTSNASLFSNLKRKQAEAEVVLCMPVPSGIGRDDVRYRSGKLPPDMQRLMN